jgi:acetyl-CoA C-acetyltransferase
VESWTVPFDRDGKPEKAFLAVRTPGGERVLAVVADADTASAAVTQDIVGASVRVHADGRADLVDG